MEQAPRGKLKEGVNTLHGLVCVCCGGGGGSLCVTAPNIRTSITSLHLGRSVMSLTHAHTLTHAHNCVSVWWWWEMFSAVAQSHLNNCLVSANFYDQDSSLTSVSSSFHPHTSA